MFRSAEERRAAELSRLEALSVYENRYYDMGYSFIAGVDECGRGCLAGPVAAAAVILPRGCLIPGVNDSKKLTPKRREAVFMDIQEKALALRFATVDACIIDSINILRASLKAMGNALTDLPVRPDVILADGLFPPDMADTGIIIEPIRGGDGKSQSIAAASIVAKVMRDRLMLEYARSYPAYGFEAHKGYGTRQHYEALAAHGPCPIHRRSFNLSESHWPQGHRDTTASGKR